MEQLKHAESYIAEIPVIQQASTLCDVRPIMIPVISIVLALLILGQLEELILTLVGFFYPAWQSYKAIESAQYIACRQWLAYWVVYASFSVAELAGDLLLFWIPFYYLLKLGFLLWLSLPRYNGATVVYDRFIQPLLANHRDSLDSILQGLRRVDAAGDNSGRRRAAVN